MARRARRQIYSPVGVAVAEKKAAMAEEARKKRKWARGAASSPTGLFIAPPGR